MLQDEEWVELQELVTIYWFLTDNPMLTLKNKFKDIQFLAQAQGLSGDSPAVNAANFILKIQRSSKPDPTISLIKGLLDTEPIQLHGDKVEFLENNLKKVMAFVSLSASNDPFSTVLLVGKRAFINRSSLRGDIKRMMEDSEKLVMRVVGESKSGTSYTKELVMHLCGAELIKHSAVNLKEFSTPKEAIQALAMPISINDDPPELEGDDEDKWIRVASRWLISLARATGEDWWLILDECNHIQNEQPLIEMINRLSEEIRQQSASAPNIRLLLLGHQAELTDELRGRFFDNDTGTLTQSDIRQALRTLADNASAEQAGGSAVDGEGISNAELDDRINELTSGIWRLATRSGSLITEDLNIALEEAIIENFF